MSKKASYGFVLACFMFSLFAGGGNVAVVRAAAPGSVVINEVAWAGSADSSTDEWIELYNTTGQAVDLTGWTINDDEGASVYNLSGSIAPYGYYLIEDTENAVNPAAADLVVNLSLANTGDSLVLYDELAQAIDTVNSSGGAWFAGNPVTYASMERIDALSGGDNASNWSDSDGNGSFATASAGSLVVGTPGLINSVSSSTPGPSVNLDVSASDPGIGDQLFVQAVADNADDLFSYGFDIFYDPAVLNLVSVNEGDFLSEGGAVATSFQYGLENGVEGNLMVAEARTIDPKTGKNGSGILFTIAFNVTGGGGQASFIGFGNESFITYSAGEVSADFAGSEITPAVSSVEPVINLQAIEAAQRYSIQLSWDPSLDVSAYRVYRRNPHGAYLLLGETASTLFVDSDAVPNGGNIVPGLNYDYRVVAFCNGMESPPSNAAGTETRGLKGDNDRSDRIDGRDLDNLARHFAEDDQNINFDPLIDTTYDGIIDGSDLIDLGANFALVYSS